MEPKRESPSSAVRVVLTQDGLVLGTVPGTVTVCGTPLMVMVILTVWLTWGPALTTMLGRGRGVGWTMVVVVPGSVTVVPGCVTVVPGSVTVVPGTVTVTVLDVGGGGGLGQCSSYGLQCSGGGGPPQLLETPLAMATPAGIANPAARSPSARFMMLPPG